MQLLLTLAQSAPFEHLDAQMGADESINWGFVVFSLLASVVIQALFGWWAMMKAEEHDSNKVAAFIAGFLFLYMGVRIAPILRYDRIFNTPRPPRPLPPRMPQAMSPGYVPPQMPLQAPPVAASVPPPAPDACPACAAPRHPGRKLCMNCGAALPNG